MKVKIAVAIALSMLFGTQSHAQSFLENLGRNIGQGIRKEVSKKINKELNNLKESVRNNNNEKENEEAAPIIEATATPAAPDKYTDSPFVFAGGIIASMNTSHVHECYNSGNICIPLGLDNMMGSWQNSMAAGICAFAAIPDIPGIYHRSTEGASFIQNCYNTGFLYQPLCIHDNTTSNIF